MFLSETAHIKYMLGEMPHVVEYQTVQQEFWQKKLNKKGPVLGQKQFSGNFAPNDFELMPNV